MTDTVKLPNGDYEGTVDDFGFMKSKSGKEMAYIRVKLKFAQSVQNVTWYGSLVSDKSKDYVLKTISKLNPSITRWDQLLNGAGIKEGTEVRVSVLNEVNPKTNKWGLKVKYINPAQQKFNKLNPKTLAAFGKAQDDGPDFDSF